MSPQAFDRAHKEWFSFMAKLIGDPAIAQYAQTDDYFPLVFEVMKQYVGKEVSDEEMTLLARNLYAMMCIEHAKREDLQAEFAIILKELSKEHHIILVTSAPSVSVNPLLAKLSVRNLFHHIIKSPLDQQPNSEDLIRQAVNTYGTGVYIGDNPQHITFAESLGLTTVLVDWFAQDHKDDSAVHEPAQILQILKTLN